MSYVSLADLGCARTPGHLPLDYLWSSKANQKVIPEQKINVVYTALNVNRCFEITYGLYCKCLHHQTYVSDVKSYLFTYVLNFSIINCALLPSDLRSRFVVYTSGFQPFMLYGSLPPLVTSEHW